MDSRATIGRSQDEVLELRIDVETRFDKIEGLLEKLVAGGPQSTISEQRLPSDPSKSRFSPGSSKRESGCATPADVKPTVEYFKSPDGGWVALNKSSDIPPIPTNTPVVSNEVKPQTLSPKP